MARLGIILLLLSSCFAQVTIKGSVALKGSVKVSGTSGGTGGIPAGIGWHILSGLQKSVCPTTANAPTKCLDGQDFAFSGGFADTNRSAICFAQPGGHGDAADPNTYCYVCSSNPCQWVRLTNYTGYTARDCSDYGDFTQLQISSNPPKGAPGACLAINGGPGPTLPGDGTVPASRHTNANTVGDPVRDAYFIISTSSCAWANGSCFDDALWKLPYGGSWSLIASSTGIDGGGSSSYEVVSLFNPNDNKIYAFDYHWLWQYDPASAFSLGVNPKKLNPVQYSLNYNLAGAIDATKNYFVMAGFDGGSAQRMVYIKLDGSDPNYALNDVTTTASANGCSGLMNVPEPGMTWDSTGGNIVGFTGKSTQGNTVYVIDSSTWHCATPNVSGADTCTSYWDSGCSGGTSCSPAPRFVYAPNIDAFIAAEGSNIVPCGLRLR